MCISMIDHICLTKHVYRLVRKMPSNYIVRYQYMTFNLLSDCISSKESQIFCGLSGEEPRASDPYIICKDICHPCFRCGDVILRPMREKPTEYVWDGVVVCILSLSNTIDN